MAPADGKISFLNSDKRWESQGSLKSKARRSKHKKACTDSGTDDGIQWKKLEATQKGNLTQAWSSAAAACTISTQVEGTRSSQMHSSLNKVCVDGLGEQGLTPQGREAQTFGNLTEKVEKVENGMTSNLKHKLQNLAIDSLGSMNRFEKKIEDKGELDNSEKPARDITSETAACDKGEVDVKGSSSLYSAKKSRNKFASNPHCPIIETTDAESIDCDDEDGCDGHTDVELASERGKTHLSHSVRTGRERHHQGNGIGVIAEETEADYMDWEGGDACGGNRASNDVTEGLSKKVKEPQGQSMYMLEAIRKRRKHKGRLEYLVKWVGYPEKENTWEPYANLAADCPDHLEEFEERCKPRRKRKGDYTLQQKKKRGKRSKPRGDGNDLLSGAGSSQNEESGPDQGDLRSDTKNHVPEATATVATSKSDGPQHAARKINEAVANIHQDGHLNSLLAVVAQRLDEGITVDVVTSTKLDSNIGKSLTMTESLPMDVPISISCHSGRVEDHAGAEASKERRKYETARVGDVHVEVMDTTGDRLATLSESVPQIEHAQATPSDCAIISGAEMGTPSSQRPSTRAEIDINVLSTEERNEQPQESESHPNGHPMMICETSEAGMNGHGMVISGASEAGTNGHGKMISGASEAGMNGHGKIISGASEAAVEMIGHGKMINEASKAGTTYKMAECNRSDPSASNMYNACNVKRPMEVGEVARGAKKRKLSVPTRVPPIKEVVVGVNEVSRGLSATADSSALNLSATTTRGQGLEETRVGSEPSIVENSEKSHMPRKRPLQSEETGCPKRSGSVDGNSNGNSSAPGKDFLRSNGLPSLIKILKARHMSRQNPGPSQESEVFVLFECLRVDGVIMIVENQYLKDRYPLMLIDFYERQLRCYE